MPDARPLETNAADCQTCTYTSQTPIVYHSNSASSPPGLQKRVIDPEPFRFPSLVYSDPLNDRHQMRKYHWWPVATPVQLAVLPMLSKGSLYSKAEEQVAATLFALA